MKFKLRIGSTIFHADSHDEIDKVASRYLGSKAVHVQTVDGKDICECTVFDWFGGDELEDLPPKVSKNGQK